MTSGRGSRSWGQFLAEIEEAVAVGMRKKREQEEAEEEGLEGVLALCSRAMVREVGKEVERGVRGMGKKIAAFVVREVGGLREEQERFQARLREVEKLVKEGGGVGESRGGRRGSPVTVTPNGKMTGGFRYVSGDGISFGPGDGGFDGEVEKEGVRFVAETAESEGEVCKGRVGEKRPIVREDLKGCGKRGVGGGKEAKKGARKGTRGLRSVGEAAREAERILGDQRKRRWEVDGEVDEERRCGRWGKRVKKEKEESVPDDFFKLTFPETETQPPLGGEWF